MLTIAKNLYPYRERMAAIAWKKIAPVTSRPMSALLGHGKTCSGVF